MNKDDQKWLLMSEKEIKEAKKESIYVFSFSICDKNEQYIDPQLSKTEESHISVSDSTLMSSIYKQKEYSSKDSTISK